MKLTPNQGIPKSSLWMLAVMAGVSVSNLYYCQPLLNLIRADLLLSEFQVNFVSVVTQAGYALGLLFIIPLGDKYDRRNTNLMASIGHLALEHRKSLMYSIRAGFTFGSL